MICLGVENFCWLNNRKLNEFLLTSRISTQFFIQLSYIFNELVSGYVFHRHLNVILKQNLPVLHNDNVDTVSLTKTGRGGGWS